MTVYLIDGYNLMHELRRSGDRAMAGDLGPGELEDERRRLVDRIASFMGGSSDRAIIAFDSSNASLQEGQSATANVEVFFGSFEHSADSIIERATYRLNAAEKVVVVTSDYGLQKTTFLANVTRRSSRQFASDLHEHTREVAITEKCTRMVHRVEDRIPQKGLEELKELRRRLEEEPERGGS